MEYFQAILGLVIAAVVSGTIGGLGDLLGYFATIAVILFQVFSIESEFVRLLVFEVLEVLV